MKESKKQEILENLYLHCAINGFSQIHNISQLSKALSVSRPLFYFYFNSSEQLFEELMQHHHKKVDATIAKVIEDKMTLHDYIYNLVKVKDVYFYTLRCIHRSIEEKAYCAAAEYTLQTLDMYNYKQFVIHYRLESLPTEDIKFLYDSFRNFCFLNSGLYHEWNKEKVDYLLKKIDAMVALLQKK
jgi:AcrR family transcriptional regulator